MHPHTPVLLHEVLEALAIAPNRIYVDGTLGAGGHTEAILSADPTVRVFGFDRDPSALAIASERLSPFGDRFTAVHASYEAMGRMIAEHGLSGVDGVLLDLGISSMQIDQAARGFAFRLEGALDMRFDPTSADQTAADLVNTLTESALADILYHYGEENDSRRIARAIVAARPIHTTKHLAEVVASAIPAVHKKGKIHPATKTFQALRIAVNDELQTLERTLPIALSSLTPGGRLAVISFHSLEDRIVKQFLKLEATDCICPPRQPICTCGHLASLDLLTRKPISATDSEIALNPRARSAVLRVGEKKVSVS
jgi:16S rRNA (cytosine1402-N4)-methyltransferase